MPSSARLRHIPLPEAWLRRVRSAVVHVVAMTRVSLTMARAHAENHFDARVRLQAENNRLRQEVALLNEELRIKDARMDRIPAQRRPHYPPMERLAILDLRAARGWSGAETARRLLVTPQTASARRRCDECSHRIQRPRPPPSAASLIASSRRSGRTPSGTSTSARSPSDSASGFLGFRSRCRSVGLSAGGSPSSSTTSRGA